MTDFGSKQTTDVSTTLTATTTTTTRHERIRRRKLSVPFIGLALLLCYTTWIDLVRGMDMTYCSPDNTAGTAANHSVYQSDGLCYNFCKEDFAFAVVLYQSCWCTNFIPEEQEDLADCVDSCPGYPSDLCGNKEKNYFGYIQLPLISPSGTAGDMPTSTVRSITSDSLGGGSVSVSVSSVGVPTTVTVVQSELGSDSSTFKTTTSSSSTWTPTPILTTITAQGKPQTVTITPTSPSDMTSQTSASTTLAVTASQKSTGFFSNTGRVAGVFTALAIAIISLIALVIFCFLRRKRQEGANGYGRSTDTPESANSSPSLGNSMTRKTMRNSVVGGGLGMAYTSDKAIPSIMATGPGGVVTPLDPRTTDQRLDPQQVWMRFENDNSSRISVRSLRDDTDYSRRVLKISNPDD